MKTSNMKIYRSHCTGICAVALSLSLLTTSCGSNTAGGALIGGIGGSMIGAIVGGSVGGPFGRDMGVLVGSLGGAAVGAGIGAAVDHAEEEQYSSNWNSRQNYEGLRNGGTSTQSTSNNRDNRSLVRIDHQGDITFDSRSCALSGSAKNALDQISTYLNGRSGDVYLYAGTDDIESRDFDFELSDSRARAVADYLIARGLSSSRIHIVALGEREPVADNTSSTGRTQNRRVEVYITQ